MSEDCPHNFVGSIIKIDDKTTGYLNPIILEGEIRKTYFIKSLTVNHCFECGMDWESGSILYTV